MRTRPYAPARANAEAGNGNSSYDGRELAALRQLAREGAPPVPLLEDAFRLIFEKSPRFRRRQWGSVLVSACRTYDRWAADERTVGLGVNAVIDLMQEHRRCGVPVPLNAPAAVQNAPQRSGPCPLGECGGDGWRIVEGNVAKRCRCADAPRPAAERKAEPVSLAYYAQWLKRRARYARQDGRGFRQAGLTRPAAVVVEGGAA